MRLLGLDPGLRLTGWGVIDVDGNRLRHVAHGVVKVPADRPLAERLNDLFEGVAAVIAAQQPAEAAVEETFVNVNPASTLKLGQARGVVLVAPARAGLKVFEYAANLVKKSVVGAGHADKHQIAMMVGRLLPGVVATADAADALAVTLNDTGRVDLDHVHGAAARDFQATGADAAGLRGGPLNAIQAARQNAGDGGFAGAALARKNVPVGNPVLGDSVFERGLDVFLIDHVVEGLRPVLAGDYLVHGVGLRRAHGQVCQAPGNPRHTNRTTTVASFRTWRGLQPSVARSPRPDKTSS